MIHKGFESKNECFLWSVKTFAHIQTCREFVKNSKTIRWQLSKLIHLLKRLYNDFKSWLLVLRLVSWQMCSIFSYPPRETPASTAGSPVLPRYCLILPIFKRISSFLYFFGRNCYYYHTLHQNIHRSNSIVITFHCFYQWLLSASLPVQYFRKISAVIPGFNFYQSLGLCRKLKSPGFSMYSYTNLFMVI